MKNSLSRLNIGAIAVLLLLQFSCQQESSKQFQAEERQNKSDQDRTYEGRDQNVTDDRIIAAEPIPVGGAFLVDCMWLHDDPSQEYGVGVCHPQAETPTSILTQTTVEGVQLLALDMVTEVIQLPKSEGELVRFQIPYQFYGQATSVNLKVLQAQERKFFEGLELKNLPQKAPVQAQSLPPPATPAPAAPTQTFAFQAFKLGDDGPTGSAQCAGLQSLAASNRLYGTTATISFEVTSDTSQVTISIARICGNGSGASGSTSLGRVEVRSLPDNTLVRSELLPLSAMATDVPDGANPTSSYSSNLSLSRGRYSVQIIVGRANGGLLDDMMIDSFKVNALNLSLIRQTVQ